MLKSSSAFTFGLLGKQLCKPHRPPYLPSTARVINQTKHLSIDSTHLDPKAAYILARIANQVKVDVLATTQDVDNEAEIRNVSRNFVSDTVTMPTKEMLLYAARASLGDAVYGDLSTKALEAHFAKLTGKDAALFMPTGTMSNQIALRTHLQQPPYSILTDVRAHIYKDEAGGTAFHSGATTIPVLPSNWHHISLDDVKNNAIVGEDIHKAPTALVALENTLNGTIIPQHEISMISDWVHGQGMLMHLDGARLWHVASATATPMQDLCEPFDSVSLCLSKGLGAPIGSVLVGSQKFINKARWFRKLFGGGMRQTGHMAACAAYALTHNFPKLAKVHALAKRLEQGLEEMGAGIISQAETCMVIYDPSPVGLMYQEIVDRAARLPEPIQLGGCRMVVHFQTQETAVGDFLNLFRQMVQEKEQAGFIRQAPKGNNLAKWLDPYGV